MKIFRGLATAAAVATLGVTSAVVAVQPAQAASSTRVCHSDQSPTSAAIGIFRASDNRPMIPGGWLYAGSCTGWLTPSSEVRIDASTVNEARFRYNSGTYTVWYARDVFDPTDANGTTIHFQTRF